MNVLKTPAGVLEASVLIMRAASRATVELATPLVQTITVLVSI